MFDGYYQQVDDDRSVDINTDDDEEIEYLPDTGLRVVPDRYSHIQQDPFTKRGRAKFCSARNAIHKEAEKQYHKDVREGTYSNLPESKDFKQCKNCRGGFIAKKADIKRGWAKFCSKSCKAQY